MLRFSLCVCVCERVRARVRAQLRTAYHFRESDSGKIIFGCPSIFSDHHFVVVVVVVVVAAAVDDKHDSFHSYSSAAQRGRRPLYPYRAVI